MAKLALIVALLWLTSAVSTAPEIEFESALDYDVLQILREADRMDLYDQVMHHIENPAALARDPRVNKFISDLQSKNTDKCPVVCPPSTLSRVLTTVRSRILPPALLFGVYSLGTSLLSPGGSFTSNRNLFQMFVGIRLCKCTLDSLGGILVDLFSKPREPEIGKLVFKRRLKKPIRFQPNTGITSLGESHHAISSSHLSTVLNDITLGREFESDSASRVYTALVDGVLVGLFKPTVAEYGGPQSKKGRRMHLGAPSPKSGFLVGECAMKEVAAYVGEWGDFAHVPPTFSISLSEMTGSVQQFVSHTQTFSMNLYRASLHLRDVQTIGLMDLSLFNVDRHRSNLLLAEYGKLVIPVDHGYILPHFTAVRAILLKTPGKLGQEILTGEMSAHNVPILEEIRIFVHNIDIYDEVEVLKEVGLHPESILTFVVCTGTVKQLMETKPELTIHEIGILLQHFIISRYSSLELIPIKWLANRGLLEKSLALLNDNLSDLTMEDVFV